jgi:hypothetical protein
MQKRREEVKDADGSTNAYVQPQVTSAPTEQNAGRANLPAAPRAQGALTMHHCNSQDSPSGSADPSSHPVMAYALGWPSPIHHVGLCVV